MTNKYNVLWLDDELNASLKYVFQAALSDHPEFNIVGVIDHNSFKEMFNSLKWDAIILDINTKADINDNQTPQNLLPLLMSDYNEKILNMNIPLFAFSGAFGMLGKVDKRVFEAQLKSYGFQQHPRTGQYYWDKSPIGTGEYQDVIFKDILTYLEKGSFSINTIKTKYTDGDNRKKDEKIDTINQKRLEFLSDLLHSLRHSLSPRIGYLKSRLAKDNGNKYDKLFDEVTDEIDDYVKYIDNLSIKQIHLNDILSKVSEKYPDLQIDIQNRTHINIDELPIYADDALQIIVFENIFANAKRHGFHDNAKNKIRIDIGIDNKTLKLSISNNGHVFKGDVKKVFDDKYCFGETKQTGKGLYLVKKYMSSIEGKVEFISEPEKEYPVTITLSFNLS